MRLTILLLLAVLTFKPAEANAASFDCHKAAFPTDFVICSNPDLLKANDALAASWFAARGRLDQAGRADLLKGQRNWLHEMAQKCGLPARGEPSHDLIAKAQQCVRGFLQIRTGELNRVAMSAPAMGHEYAVIQSFLSDPPDDISSGTYQGVDIERIACWASAHDPKQALSVFVGRYGSLGRFSPICGEWAISDKVPELQPLLALYNTVSGYGTSFCGGTIVIDIAHAGAVLEWQAAIDIGPAKRGDGTIDSLQFPANIDQWVQQGSWEAEELQEMVRLRAIALPKLEAFYRTTYGLGDEEAHRLSAYYLNKLADFYLGQASSNPSQLARSYEFGLTSVDDVRTFLKNGAAAQEGFPPEQLVTLLKIAIVNNFSMADITTILKAIIANAVRNPAAPHSSADAISGQTEPFRETPLMKAATRPDVLAELLATKLWDVNAQNWFGKTALMYALQGNSEAGVELLLAAKANPNLATLARNAIAQDDCYMNGIQEGSRTPLMYAAWYSSQAIIKRLLDAGADRTAQDEDGNLAGDYLAKNATLTPDQQKLAAPLLAAH